MLVDPLLESKVKENLGTLDIDTLKYFPNFILMYEYLFWTLFV